MDERHKQSVSIALVPDRATYILPPLQVSIREAARLLGFHERTIYRLIERGELPVVGRGRLRRIALKDLHAWQDRNREE